MRTVMSMCWQGLTVGTEIGVVANSALVSIANDVSMGAFVGTERSIALYAVMTLKTLRT